MGAANVLFLSPSWTWSLNDKTDANFYRIKFVRVFHYQTNKMTFMWLDIIGCVLSAGPSLRKAGKSGHLAHPCVFPLTSKYTEKEAECTNWGFILFLGALRMRVTPLWNIEHPHKGQFLMKLCFNFIINTVNAIQVISALMVSRKDLRLIEKSKNIENSRLLNNINTFQVRW